MYFEDYEVGQVFILPEKVRLSRDEIIENAKVYDPREIHLEEENDYYDDIISPGLFSIMSLWGARVRTKKDADGMIAGVGIKSANRYRPIFPDEDLTVSVEIIGKELRKDKKTGYITYRLLASNPAGDPVLRYEPYALVRCRNCKDF